MRLSIDICNLGIVEAVNVGIKDDLFKKYRIDGRHSPTASVGAAHLAEVS